MLSGFGRSWTKRDLDDVKARPSLHLINWYWPYVFLMPFFILFGTFLLGPIMFALVSSFTSWTIGEMNFIGLSNYRNLLSDAKFWLALKNTVFITVMGALTAVGGALLLALLLDSIRSTVVRRVFRSIYFVPITASLAVVAIIFDLIYGKDYGLLNIFLGMLGLKHKIGWLIDAKVAIWSIIILRTWRVVGYFVMFLLAGLQSIPETLYEAAKVDGAGRLALIKTVTLPLLRPMLLFVLVWATVWGFVTFEEPWILTQGGPGNATLTLVMYLYQNGFLFFKLGYGSAISFMLTVLMIVFSLLEMRFGRTREDE